MADRAANLHDLRGDLAGDGARRQQPIVMRIIRRSSSVAGMSSQAPRWPEKSARIARAQSAPRSLRRARWAAAPADDATRLRSRRCIAALNRRFFRIGQAALCSRSVCRRCPLIPNFSIASSTVSPWRPASSGRRGRNIPLVSPRAADSGSPNGSRFVNGAHALGHPR